MRWKQKPIARARELRRELTDAERKLWGLLRDRGLAGVKFRRQVPIGRFIADFACIERKLIIEVDGGQHAEHVPYDAARTQELEALGFRVLRFWNNDVLSNPEGVFSVNTAAIEASEPSPGSQRAPPSPASGRGSG